MSNKERVLQLIDDIPDNKLKFIVDMLESLRAYAGETTIPGEYDPNMINDAKNEDGDNIIVEIAKDLDIVM